MADYRQIARHFPAVRDYLRHRRWQRRGQTVAYAPGLRTASFSTDAAGFRHSVFEAREFSVSDAWSLPRYALVLGSSHVFGFGLASNAETLASRLSERLGYPCLTVCFPEAETRTLHTSLLRILFTAPNRPERVFLLNGGDLTRFCYVGRADAVFGCGDFENGKTTEPTLADSRSLIAFTSFWTRQMAEIAARAGAVFTLADEPTFFEKTSPTAREISNGLGLANAGSARRFDMHRELVWEYHAARDRIRSEMFGLAPWTSGFDEFGYIDEYHYDAPTLQRIAALLVP